MIRVMLVDDEPLILEGLQYIIDWESIGFKIVATAKNGLEALQLAQSIKFDLLITDIKMPELTGLELIESLNKLDKQFKSIILSGFQEFDLIKKGLQLGIENYLLKPINEAELLSSLLHVKEKINVSTLQEESFFVLRDHSIWRWVMGKMALADFKERVSLYPRTSLNPPLYMGLLKLEQEEQDESFLHSLQQKIEEETNVTAALTPSGDFLLMWCKDSLQDDWENEKVRFLDFVQRCEFPGEHVCVLSDPVPSYHQVTRVYRELEMTCELKLLLPHKDHRIAEQMYLSNTNFNEQSTETTKYLNRELLELLANEQYEAVRASISKMLSQIGQDRQILIMKGVLLEFFFHVKNKFLILLDYPQYVEMIHQILYMSTHEEAMNIVDKCIGMIEKDSNDEGEKYSPIIYTVLNHILKNYAIDMSLKTLGHQFHINPIYLGQLFQKEVGTSFTKYLNKLRIDRAKKLLLHSHEKAGHIGKKVGYIDATYFYKQFKKFEDMTPSEWRKNNRQDRLEVF
ncbi:response regulator transcription factor [Sutcliffiella halmapala]|uniref:response regulator transcription factor n=1 Tax=Sutcliffiella halmapala TaxID=79882 RepID=UPI0009957219|nr:response regulator transcription factor [Sutcliffiella halmapala]